MRVKTICIMYAIVVCLVLTSCCTAKPITDGLVIEHSRQLAVLEAGIRSYGETVSAVAGEIAAVRDRAAASGATIDATIKLFDEYQRAVDRLISDYNALRTTVDAAQ